MVKFICTHKLEDEMYYSYGLKVYEREFHLVIMHLKKDIGVVANSKTPFVPNMGFEDH